MHVWLTERIESGEQEIHNEDTHTSLLSAYGDPEQPNEVMSKKNEEKWFCCRETVPWQCNRVGCSCRRHTEVRSVGADIHRRDTESFPPPPLTGQDVCRWTGRKGRFRIKPLTERTATADRRRGEVSPNYIFNLLPVRWHNVVAVLWSHQHSREAKGGLFQAGTLTFDNCRGENGNHIYTHTGTQPVTIVVSLILSLSSCMDDSRVGNLLMLLLTRISMRAALRWSPLFTWICIKTHSFFLFPWKAWGFIV